MGHSFYIDLPHWICGGEPVYHGEGFEYSPGMAHIYGSHFGGVHFGHLCDRWGTNQCHYD